MYNSKTERGPDTTKSAPKWLPYWTWPTKSEWSSRCMPIVDALTAVDATRNTCPLRTCQHAQFTLNRTSASQNLSRLLGFPSEMFFSALL
ncbi:hypothetical protein BdWA1_000883 [Babesia duncani]|uniref:Uncharacterized protein n=1 Tax=Babesia duncani TaxID=323732 RepID=A0AAD9PND9_9APIC|nr:hypothetical protein BdWA1_000883 [Babesia duncani]